ncbi:probable NADPH-cytochrome P450 reductase [Serendipita indica DSM 11827]|uniref:NADPH--cytochrome P450 reductase n=1 Tax=Serendipita indica (strain DSM 11827) TaxID=1109443 RepID=G4T8K5_SERID|nr:probable NADPH-cytochrome P450 reductase [Serendipita indica DSM 11827]
MGSEYVMLTFGAVVAAVFVFRDSLFGTSSKAPPVVNNVKPAVVGGGDPRDFVARMKAGKKRLVIFYGSQTGTAEEYAIRIAKEAKSRYGLASLVCDPEEYDFENLDAIPEDCAVIFVMATYGEGEPTDNAVQLMQNLEDPDFNFSKGEHRLDGLKYVVFGLGNKTYEHYNLIARKTDAKLEEMGATRLGPRGEGDDDKAMEEDYLEWKEQMWPALAEALNVEEGAGGDTPDFVVTEEIHPDEKVFLGELSARALNKTRGIHDAKNPYPAPILATRELFRVGGARNCVHIELGIEDSGIHYQHGDHVGVWPTNPEIEVDRLLHSLGLWERRATTINIISLDPMLAKVPFPVPTTYETVLRHYIDISAVAGRQTLGILSKFAPTEESKEKMIKLATDKEHYHRIVAEGCLRLGQVLQYVTGHDILTPPTAQNTTAWSIPFEVIVSCIPRLQPRYYSISSSPKYSPKAIHVTAVVLKYESIESPDVPARWIYGVGSNLLLNLQYAHKSMQKNDPEEPMIAEPVELERSHVPHYAINGPRGAYNVDSIYKVPIHVRRSTFRLPTNPRTPVIMIGPGTGVAPFRGFVQERVTLAERTIAKHPETGISDWGTMWLFYGCRGANEDFLYKEEWPKYAEVLGDKFSMHVAISREGPRKPDGSKIYVQDLLWQQRDQIREALVDKKGYVYVCGDAKNMSKAVEHVLMRILGEAKPGGTAAVEGQKELNALKEKSRYLTDVWS